MTHTTNDDRVPEALSEGSGGVDLCMVRLGMVRLGDWDVEASLNLLRRGEQEVRLEPKVMEVLVFLIGRAGEVVSRDVLLTTVWQGWWSGTMR